MKKNLTFLIITVILAIIAFVLLLQNRQSTLKGNYKDFAVNDTSNICKIFLADKKNRTILLERKDSAWILNGKYKARKDGINNILEAMKRMEVKEPVPKAAHDNVVRRMSAIGVKVEIYQVVPRIRFFNIIQLFPHVKLTKVFYVGDATQDHLGTYMLMEHSNTPYVTYIQGFMGFLTPRFSTKLDDWRDHTIFHVPLDNIKSLKVEFPKTPENSYTIDKNGKELKLISLSSGQSVANFDTAKLISALAYFRNVNFESLLEYNQLKIDSLCSDGVFQIITLTDLKNKRTVVRTFRKKAEEGELDLEGNPVKYDRDRLYAKINGGADFVLIQYFVFDNITRPLSYFMRKENSQNENHTNVGDQPNQ